MNPIYHAPQSTAVFNLTDPIWIKPATTHPRYAPTRAVRQLGLFKKQTGGMSLFGLLTIIVEPLPSTNLILFENAVPAAQLPVEYLPTLLEATWHSTSAYLFNEANVSVAGFRLLIIDAVFHAVDSNPRSFGYALRSALKEAFASADLQPLVATASDQLQPPHFAKSADHYRTIFQTLTATIEAHCLERVLLPAGFRMVGDTHIYVRDIADVRQVVQFHPRWHAVLQIRFGVIVPAVAELLTGLTEVAAQVDNFYAGMIWQNLTALHGESTLLTRYGVALGTEPHDHTLAEQICNWCQMDGLTFLAQWQSAESILTAAHANDLTLGTERLAALHHLFGDPSIARHFITTKLAELTNKPHSDYFILRLRTLQTKLLG